MTNKKLSVNHRLYRRESKNLAYNFFFHVTDTQTSKQIFDTTYVLLAHETIITPHEKSKQMRNAEIPLAEHDWRWAIL